MPKPSRFSESSLEGRAGESEGGYLRDPAQLISQYPLASLLTGLSVGFGLGVLAVAILVPEPKKTWTKREDYTDLLHDAASQIKGWPSAIAKHLPDALTHR